MASSTLRLVAPASAPDDLRRAARPPCRTTGCTDDAADGLGFCDVCRRGYEAHAVRRWRLVEAVIARLAHVGDPLFAAFGDRPRALGEHVVAHLEELDARAVYVPPNAVRDYIAELDERHPRTG